MKLDNQEKDKNSQNRFFKNLPNNLLQTSLPTMRNIIIVDKDEELSQQEEPSQSVGPI
ncbi:Uncharacterised protein [Legionella busanensis]|uniref:Uncharacterized protein n=1 Tax=Legionella busanensis TaxID=190655 RepID=A0A378JMP8_9GAMM|nr:hypothetical protein [Legionella busanensis]STX52636.1 Uncharacterised protein [Legionella busanensis]